MSPPSWHFEKKNPTVGSNQIFLHFVYTCNPFILICVVALIQLTAKIISVSQTIQTLNSLLKESSYSIVTYLHTPRDGSLSGVVLSDDVWWKTNFEEIVSQYL